MFFIAVSNVVQYQAIYLEIGRTEMSRTQMYAYWISEQLLVKKAFPNNE